MTQKQKDFAARIERLRAAEQKEAALKASNRDERPLHNPNKVKPVEVSGYPGFDTRFAVTGPIVGGFKTMGIGRYL